MVTWFICQRAVVIACRAALVGALIFLFAGVFARFSIFVGLCHQQFISVMISEGFPSQLAFAFV